MGLASEMKNLSEELLASFKQRIKENEELVNDVQQTLDNFRKDHMEMAAVLNANAAALRKGLARGEKERLHTYHDLMTDIHHTISAIQQEVMGIQTSTVNMIKEFTVERGEMAGDLEKFFAEGRADREQNEKTRMEDFNTLMNDINSDIKTINEVVQAIFKNTNDMLDRFEKEHLDMSDELRAELAKTLAERVAYTKSLLNGFQKRLSEISKENHKMAQKLRKDLDNGETERLNDYNGIMKGIHTAIKEIRKEVRDIEKATDNMIGDLTQDRAQASATWAKMQTAMEHIRETGVTTQPKHATKKAEKKEVKPAPAVEVVKEAAAEVKPKAEPKPVAPMSLEQKVLDYINKHPKGVKISEMEEPLGETRMKLGFTAKGLLDEGKVQKIENIYFPKTK